MKAIVLNDVEKLSYEENWPEPQPEARDVVVRVEAAALNRRDLWIKRGLYAGLKFPIIPGSDAVGVLESDLGELRAGTRVLINPSLDWGENPNAHGKNFTILGLPRHGTLAERVAVPAENVFPVPEHLTTEEAAALPLAGLTAYRALFTRARLQRKERVLVTGVGAGTAGFAMLFALAAGAEVYVTSGSEEKLRRAKELGATAGANYHCSNWGEQLVNQGGLFDVIIDSAGGPGLLNAIDIAAPGARIVNFGATQDNPPELPMRKVFWKQLSILGTTMGTSTEFCSMLSFVEKHKIRPIVGATYALAEAEHAFDLMAKTGQFGKIVLKVA